MNRMQLETDLEQNHRKRAIADGWFVEKIMRTARRGFPDRFYAKRGRVVLIEWKRPGRGRVSAQQVKRHAELRAAGVEVHVVDSLAKAERILHMDNSRGPDQDSSADKL